MISEDDPILNEHLVCEIPLADCDDLPEVDRHDGAVRRPEISENEPHP